MTTPTGPESQPIKKMEASESFTKSGKTIRKGKERQRYNVDPENDRRLAIAAKETLKGGGFVNAVKSLGRVGRYVTVSTDDGKTIDLNINSLAKRLHISKKEILAVRDNPEDLKKLIDSVDKTALKQELDWYLNPNEILSEMRTCLTETNLGKFDLGKITEDILKSKFESNEFKNSIVLYEGIENNENLKKIYSFLNMRFKPGTFAEERIKKENENIAKFNKLLSERRVASFTNECAWKVFAFKKANSDHRDAEIYKKAISLLDQLYELKAGYQSQNLQKPWLEPSIASLESILKKLSAGKIDIKELESEINLVDIIINKNVPPKS